MNENEILAAIYGALSSNPLNGTICRVYDQGAVPDEEPGPYIVLGNSQAIQGELQNESERAYSLDIHIWSSRKGRKECQAIARDIDSLLGDKSLSVGGSSCWIWFEELQLMFDESSNWWHGILTLRTEFVRQEGM